MKDGIMGSRQLRLQGFRADGRLRPLGNLVYWANSFTWPDVARSVKDHADTLLKQIPDHQLRVFLLSRGDATVVAIVGATPNEVLRDRLAEIFSVGVPETITKQLMRDLDKLREISADHAS